MATTMERLLLWILLVTARLAATKAQGVDFEHRRLLEFDPLILDRHNKPPVRKHAKLDYPISKFSHLMTSDCRPSSNGFFGSTSGTPAILEYGYSLETTVFADVDRILDVIDEHVMSAVLSHTFSSVCPASGRRLSLASSRMDKRLSTDSARVTGFRFHEESVDDSAPCDPEIHPKNSCSFYKSTVKVFGQNMDSAMMAETLDVVRQALPVSLSMASKYGAVRLVLADHLTRTVSIPPSVRMQPTHRITPGGAVGLIIVIFLVITCIALFVYYWRNDVLGLQQQKKHPSRHSRSPPTRREHEFMNYFNHRSYNDGSLTNTAPETASRDSSYDRTNWKPWDLPWDQLAKRNSQHDKRKYSHPDKAKQKKIQHSKRQHQQSRRQPCHSKDSEILVLGEINRPPVILEFGQSFDPERDRFMVDMEEESSAPPSYMYAPNAPPDFMFVWQQQNSLNFQSYDYDIDEYQHQYTEDEFAIKEIQII